MILTVFSPRLRMWRRRAFDMRERQGIALATVQTYLGTKSLSNDEVTEVTTGLTA
jgi:hypothetical protein